MSKENYYVNPVEFKNSLKRFYETDVITDDLADNVNKIAYGLSFNGSFINYTYKDDMIGDALIKMYSALTKKKYSFDKRTEKGGEDQECNPFSYFTTIASNAFINRIKKEKRHHEAEKQYRERVYENVMTESAGSNGVYVKPVGSEDEFYNNDH